MQARGLDLAAIGGLYAIYGIVTIALELPTGGLADVVGRRTVLVAAAIATTVSMLVAAVAQDPAWFALAMVLGATGRALGSGPLDAWYVDATHALDPEASVRHGLARGQAAEALALGLGAVIGGLLPAICLAIWPSLASGPIIGLSVPLLLAAAMTAANGVAVVLVVHEQRPAWIGVRAIAGGVPSTIRDGLRLGFGDPMLRRLMVRAGLLGVVLAGIELLAPGTFAALLGGESQASGVYGIFAAAAFAANAAGSSLAPGRRPIAWVALAPRPSRRSRPGPPSCSSPARSWPWSAPGTSPSTCCSAWAARSHRSCSTAAWPPRSGRRCSRSSRSPSRSVASSRTSRSGRSSSPPRSAGASPASRRPWSPAARCS